MMEASELVDVLARQGFGPFVGVPCSLLAPLFSELAGRGALTMATDEGEAVGIAAGMYLAGRKPVVLMQNAGFLHALNPLLSLHAVFELPLLLVVSHRGEPGTSDAPEHELCGQLTEPLLELARIGHEHLPAHGGELLEACVRRATAAIAAGGRHALLVSRGTLHRTNPSSSYGTEASPWAIGTSLVGEDEPEQTIRRSETIAAVLAGFPDAVFVASTGFIARETIAATAHARPYVFPVIGSMGCAAPLALGLALAAPRARVIVLDGDGALLMKLGVLASIGSLAPANLVHVVLNDGVYASTGGQPNAAARVSLPSLARAAGYDCAVAVTSRTRLEHAIEEAARQAGPRMICVATSYEPETVASRIAGPPALYASRLRDLQLCKH